MILDSVIFFFFILLFRNLHGGELSRISMSWKWYHHLIITVLTIIEIFIIFIKACVDMVHNGRQNLEEKILIFELRNNMTSLASVSFGFGTVPSVWQRWQGICRMQCTKLWKRIVFRRVKCICPIQISFPQLVHYMSIIGKEWLSFPIEILIINVFEDVLYPRLLWLVHLALCIQ